MGQWSHDITGVIGNWGVTRNVKAEVRFWGGGGVMVVRDTPSRGRRKRDRKEKRSEEKKSWRYRQRER